MSVERPPVDASLSIAAAWIREMCPITGATATDQECRIRGDLINAELKRRRVAEHDQVWFTAQLASGRVVGSWAESPESAELSISVWWAEDCHWVVPDPDQRYRREHFTNGVRAPAEQDRSFPLGPPRRPRDRFAPTESLLTGLSDLGEGISL